MFSQWRNSELVLQVGVMAANFMPILSHHGASCRAAILRFCLALYSLMPTSPSDLCLSATQREWHSSEGSYQEAWPGHAALPAPNTTACWASSDLFPHSAPVTVHLPWLCGRHCAGSAGQDAGPGGIALSFFLIPSTVCSYPFMGMITWLLSVSSVSLWRLGKQCLGQALVISASPTQWLTRSRCPVTVFWVSKRILCSCHNKGMNRVGMEVRLD